MIDAVNSTIANTLPMRSGVSLDGVEPPVPSEAPRAPQAPFVSPYIAVDLDFDKAVLQIRDSETGDVKQQFPTQSRLIQLSRAQERLEVAQASQRQDQNSYVESIAQQTQQVSDVVTIQDITSSLASNQSLPAPQIAAAALSTGAQSAQTNVNTGASVSVLA